MPDGSPFTRSDFDEYLDRFDSAWHDGRPPEIRDYDPPPDAIFEAGISGRDLLLELIMVDMEYRWKRARETEGHEAPTANSADVTLPDQAKLSDYLDLFPELGRYDDLPSRVIVNEYRVRQRWGDRPSHDAYLSRLPDRADELKSALDSVDSRQSPATEGGGLWLRCPNCGRTIDVGTVTRTRRTTCPHCETTFSLFDTRPEAEGHGGYRSVAHFELLERIGVGAFGTVWRARDTKLDRTVALKVPRAEQQCGTELERFFREARAAAQLDHPYVVSVHEVGRDGETVYIASDYVEGASLAEFLESGRMTREQAVEFCVKVALALDHAHQRGVVHRDLKPANIMLDAAGDPRIMDFGLAKRDAGEIMTTVEGRLLGTPAYMSPEQARGEAHAVDRRTDVYSLGVILFELLTGELPFRGNTRMLLEQVLRDEAPSLRKLDGGISRDLETITLKCLEKEPRRRYDTSRSVADELQRVKRGLPIQARPISAAARAWRWCRRNSAVAALLALVVVALLVGTSVSSMLAVLAAGRARENAVLAEQRETARRAADKAREDAVAELAKRREAQQLIDASLESYVETLNQSELANDKRHQPLVRQLLAHAQEYFEQSVELNRDDPEKQIELARSLRIVGDICMKAGDARRAIEMYQEVTRVVRGQLPELPSEPRVDLAQIHMNIGDLSDDIGDSNTALQQAEAARVILEDLVRDEPSVAHFRSRLAMIFNNRGKLKGRVEGPQGALSDYRRATDMMERIVAEQPDNFDYQDQLAGYYSNLGDVHRLMGDAKAAADSLDKAIEIGEKLVDARPVNVEYKRGLANYYLNRSAVRLSGAVADPVGVANPGGEENLLKALELLTSVVRGSPHVAEVRADLAAVHLNLGVTVELAGRMTEAQDHYRSAVERFEEVASEQPAVSLYRKRLAMSHMALAMSLMRTGKQELAIADIQRAISIQESLVDDQLSASELTDVRAELAHYHLTLGAAQHESNDQSSACVSQRESIRILEELIHRNPGSANLRSNLGLAYNSLALYQSEDGQLEQARENYDKSVAILESLIRDFPQRHEYKVQLATFFSNIGKMHSDNERTPDAIASYQRAIAELPTDVRFDATRAVFHNNLGWQRRKSGEHLAGAAEYEKSVELLTPIVRAAPGMAKERARLNRALSALANIYLEDEQFDRSLEAWDKFAEVIPLSPRQRRHVEYEKAMVLVRAGRHAMAADTVDSVLPFAAEHKTKFLLARVYALCAHVAYQDESIAEDQRILVRDEYARRASDIVVELSDEGYFDQDATARKNLVESVDFAIVREHPAVRGLIEE